LHLPDSVMDCIVRFMDACEREAERHPSVVVVLMHELFRNLYPTDPYIESDGERHQLDVCLDVMERGITVLDQFKTFGAYHQKCDMWDKHVNDEELKVATGKVYGALWNEFPDDIVDEATRIVQARLSGNGIDVSLFKGRRVLDAGCGSGRYSIALSRLGAGEVVGIDYGDDGLNYGRQLVERCRVDNVTFQKGSLLDLPFPDESFDFVYANGTIHHTGDIPKGTREAFRVMKKDGACWYYIYGAGGVFWTVRKFMNILMKKIPQNYAMDVLRLIGMPSNRFIFCDSWYVPVEEHTTREQAEELFKNVGFSSWKRCSNGVNTDIDYLAQYGGEKDRLMWGEGDHRYVLWR